MASPYVNGVYCAMRFVETPIFTTVIRRFLDDDAYRALQMALLLRPEQGPLITGSGGLRKIRWGYGDAGNGAGFGSSTTGRRAKRRSTCCMPIQRTRRVI